jgi:predicted AlkP superfamily pyrophosphatase or phosphodiesterase
MTKTVVINAVGLTSRLIGSNTPRLKAFADAGAVAKVNPPIPAVTTTVQSTYLTGTHPSEHGIVGNGWYFRDECDVKFWRQSNHLVQRPKIWEKARALDPHFTCANLFWWYNMYSSADYSVTPRPMYPADGRKIPDIYTHPADLRNALQGQLGQFPLFNFWGPATDIKATQWIAEAALRIDARHNPTLTLIYLPHLDYVLQREGPEGAATGKNLRELDAICGQLIDYYQRQSARIIILSEYGITRVNDPIHVNRIFREAGLIAVRDELGHEVLDPGASTAFAVADHQIAHVHVNDAHKMHLIRTLLEAVPGVARILDEQGKREFHLNHPRAGDLVLLAKPDSWFTYYYWLNDRRAPDFARTVDIHRKPGYDPAELFIDPKLRFPRLKIARMLLKKKLGFRTLMNVIPLDAALVRGSHGLPPPSPADAPVFITQEKNLLTSASVEAVAVCDLMLKHLVSAP